jgi:hypothetical protein
MQLRADPKDVSDCFRNILHDAQIPSKIQLDMVSFAWSPDANGSLVDISGFIRAHRQVRGGTIDEWIQDERITEKVAWKPCDGEKGKDWTSHPLITKYLTESSSDGRTREFWKWDVASSKLVPCAGMPMASKRGPKKHADSVQAAAENGHNGVQSINFPKKRKRPDGLASTQGFSVTDKKAASILKKLPLIELQTLLRAEHCPIRGSRGYNVPNTEQECVTEIVSIVGSHTILRGAANAAAAIAAVTTAAIAAADAAAAANTHPAATYGEESTPAGRRCAHAAAELEVATLQIPCIPARRR